MVREKWMMAGVRGSRQNLTRDAERMERIKLALHQELRHQNGLTCFFCHTFKHANFAPFLQIS